MPRPLAVLLAVSALVTPALSQSATADELAPAQWPELRRAAQAVPGFAGVAFVWVDGAKYRVPALKDAQQEARARAFMSRDKFWNQAFAFGSGVSRGFQPVKYDGLQLVQAAEALRKRRPNLTVRINTTLNRVLVYAPSGVFLPVARAAGVTAMVDSGLDFERLPPVRFDVQPRTLSLSALRTIPPKGGFLPGLNVRITNPTGAPIVYHPKCGGVILTVARADGSALPDEANRGGGAVCADVLESVLIQPGQTMTLPANIHVNFNALTPGNYQWVIGKTSIPFTLRP